MDISIEKAADITLGSLFQQIINDMKNSSPLWEDFIVKATKLHACLRAAIQAISSYLEAFQKIADAATNSKGASKEIGTALTRVCLRHKAVETRLKTFTTAIMDSLIIPMQDKLEEWKRQVVILDKEHTKEYKRCRNELKKRSSDTLRLQKKAKKGTSDNLQSLMDSSFASVNLQKAELDDVERKSLRIAMIEDRTRFCQFVNMLEPVVKQEYEMMYELGHLQEAMLTVTNVTKDPTALPQASEELIAESKTSFNLYPESPTHSSSQGCSNSLGSRKSSVCSISSMNSSGSSGSPGHQQFQRSLSQYNPTIRLKPGESTESRDSGFCSSSPALTIQASTATNQSHAISTWPPPGAQETVANTDRPHTISSAYERGHQRPALTVYTFQNPDQNINEISNSNSNISNGSSTSAQKSPASISVANRPPLPIRCSSLERPLSTTTGTTTTPNAARNSNTSARPSCPSPIPAHVAKEYTPISQPTYVNMSELASMAANKVTNNASTTSTSSSSAQNANSPVLSSTSSLVSPDSSATNPISSPEAQTPQNTPQTNSPLTAAILGDTTDDISASTTPTNQIINTALVDASGTSLDNNNIPKTLIETKCDSPLIDTKSSGSVHEKASMFERKLSEEQQSTQATAPLHHPHPNPLSLLNNSTLNLTPATVARLESIYGKKTEEIYGRTTTTTTSSTTSIMERVVVETVEPLDAIDTLELDNLIGELDLFQREHEAKQQERKQRMQNGYHNNCEYQTPNPITATTNTTIITHQNSLNNNNMQSHNDSFISTSTTITHAFSNGTANNVHASDDSVETKSASLNYSITSTISSDVPKFTNCSDEPCYNDCTDLSSCTGFENPSFRHLNDTSSSSSSNIVLIRDDDLPSSYYTRNSTDAVVVLRSKGLSSNNNSMTDLSQLETPSFEQKFQRLSSFKFENNNLSFGTPNGSPSHYYSSSNNINNNSSSSPSIPSISKGSLSSHGSFGALMYGQIEDASNATSNSVNVNNNMNVVTTTASNKPTLAPRPASLMSGVSRIARRSSVNTVKPPPPVRRSSSATPSHYSDSNTSQTNNMQVQQQLNSSSEALPAPPEYMLRANPPQPQQNNAKTHYMTSSSSVGQIATSTMKMINELRQSPGVMRRQLSLINHSSSNHSQPTNTHSITYSSQPSTPKLEKDANNSSSMFSIYGMTTANNNGTYSNSNDIFGTMPRQSKPQQQQPPPQQQQQHGIYAQPKQMSTVSSFRTSSSSPNSTPPPPAKSGGLLASLTARITPNKSSQSQQQPQQPPPQQVDYEKARNEPIYQRRTSNQSYYDGERAVDDYQTGNYSSDKSDSVLAKTAPGFLDNLNAKLAEQRANNKAYAVRSYINSKVVRNVGSQIPCNIKYVPNRYPMVQPEPDPRIVRESLMDQIRRGADLKRAVNDPR